MFCLLFAVIGEKTICNTESEGSTCGLMPDISMSPPRLLTMVWCAAILSICTLKTDGVSIARPAYGVIFTEKGTLLNSNSLWTNHLFISDEWHELLPADVREINEPGRMCTFKLRNLNTNNTYAIQALSDLKSVCESYLPIIHKLAKQREIVMTKVHEAQRDVRTLLRDQHSPKRGARTRRSAPLDAVSTLGRLLFGFAKNDDVIKIYGNLANLRKQVNSSLIQLLRDTNNLESMSCVHEQRLTNLTRHMVQNSKAVNNLFQSLSHVGEAAERRFVIIDERIDFLRDTVITMNRIMVGLHKGLLSQSNALQILYDDVLIYKQSLVDILRGNLNPRLLPPEALRHVLLQVQHQLLRSHPTHTVAITELSYYYRTPLTVFRIQGGFIALLTIPLTSDISTFRYYSTNILNIPIDSRNQSASTKISNLGEFFAISDSGEYYLQFSKHHLEQCVGLDRFVLCHLPLLQTSNQKNTCALALFHNNHKDVTEQCQLSFHNHTVWDTQIFPISSDELILTTSEKGWSVTCPRRSTRSITDCRICQIKLGCSCALHNKYHNFPASLDHCQADRCGDINITFPFNSLALTKLYGFSDYVNLSGLSTTPDPSDVILPKIDLRSVDTSEWAFEGTRASLKFAALVEALKSNETVYVNTVDRVAFEVNDLRSIVHSPLYRGLYLAWITVGAMASVAMIYLFFRVHALAAICSIAMQKPVRALPMSSGDGDRLYNMENLLGVLSLAVTLIIIMTCLLPLLRRLAGYLIRRRYLIVDAPPRFPTEKSHIYMKIIAASEDCVVYVSTINFPARLVELTVTSCDIIVIPRVRWGGLVNYFDVNWGGRNLLLSETDQKVPLPTRVTAPPFAVPHKWCTPSGEMLNCTLVQGNSTTLYGSHSFRIHQVSLPLTTRRSLVPLAMSPCVMPTA